MSAPLPALTPDTIKLIIDAVKEMGGSPDDIVRLAWLYAIRTDRGKEGMPKIKVMGDHFVDGGGETLAILAPSGVVYSAKVEGRHLTDEERDWVASKGPTRP